MMAGRTAWISDLPAVLGLPVALIGARLGPVAGALAGLAAGALQAGLWISAHPGSPPLSPMLVAALLALTGAGAGAVAARQQAKQLRAARAVWTSLRLGQVSEFLSYCLYQLREYQISATSLVESVALSAPKGDAAFTERLERLRRVIAELNVKAARLLGENSGVTTQPVQIAALSLAKVVRESAAEAKAAFSSADVAVSVVEDGPCPQITCDRRPLRLSLLAVLQNALETCGAKGRGSVSIVIRQRERAEIEIVDDGGGVAADMSTLFEPFYAARSGTSGMGLGLPMARRLIERLGGSIRVKSEGGATAVLIELPVTRELPFVRNEESTWAGRRQSA